MKTVFISLSLIFGTLVCKAEVVIDPRVEDPRMREALRKQAEAAEAVKSKEDRSPTTKMPQQQHGPRPQRTLSENEVCNSELTVFAQRPSLSAPPLQTCKMYLDSQFSEAIQKFIPLCAKSAAAYMHWNIPTHVSLEQMGGFADRKINTPSGVGSSWSRHSVGKALDISALTLHNGTSSYKIDLTNRTQNQNFYDAFRTCWDNSMKSFLGKECTCSIGHSHTHEPSNDLHDDHMHVSLSCPTQSGVAVCANF